jgi:hypothetical protein
MELTKDKAQQMLEEIKSTGDGTRLHLVHRFGGKLLIWWGALGTLAYILTYALVLRENYMAINWVWGILMTLGWLGMWRMGSRHPVRNEGDWRFGALWGILFAYGALWLLLLYPWNGAQMNLFLITLVMFAYVIIGLFGWRPMFWLGLVVTGLILGGYLLLRENPVLWLWMAVCVGGGLAGTGTAIMLKARG